MTYKGATAREYRRRLRAQRRADWVNANGPCRHCGSREDLEIDHIDPRTKCFNPRALWLRSRAVREDELAKCQVLCAKCHTKKTAAELSGEGGPGAKLPASTVRLVRHDLGRGIQQWKLAAFYGVSQEAISAIRTGRSWRNLP